VVLDNGHYGETGMQPSHTSAGIDFVAVALACRFKHARTASRIDEAADVRDLLHKGEGPILVNAKINADDVPRVLPLRDGHAIKQRFIEALNSA
jgi:thiamine pyrophosphate-dependent acetolactate synthase large subunit-like protein